MEIVRLARAEVFHAGAKALSQVVPGTRLSFRQRTSLEIARDFSSKGQFLDAAQSFFTLWSVEANPQIRFQRRIDLVQELINLGSFRQAEGFLKDAREVEEIKANKRAFPLARVQEKKGWIADLTGGYWQSLKYFKQTTNLLGVVFPDQRDDIWTETYSTAQHFQGRAHYNIAELGFSPKFHLSSAVVLFDRAQRIDREQVQNSFSDGKVGFGYGWLARCEMLRVNQPGTDKNIELMEQSFDRQIEKTGREGLRAYVCLIRGLREMNFGTTNAARAEFEQARKLRLEVEKYPKGLADAYAGLALVDFRDGRIIPGVKNTYQSFKAHPITLLKGSLGS